jgi:hypothetical protein
VYEWLLNMSRNRIDQAIENICLKGCLSVREDIKLLQSGVILPELRDFDELARHLVLQELQSIMAVYGDACPAVRKVPVPNSKK